MFTSFGARVITLFTLAPASASTTLGKASAAYSRSASEIVGETSRRSLIFPLI